MEWFRKLLEQIDVKDGQIDIDKVMKDVEAEFSKNAVSIDEYNILNERLIQSEKDIKNRDKQLEELKKVDVDKLNSEIIRLQQENKANKEKVDADIRQMKISHAIDIALMKANIKGDKALMAVKALLNLEDIEFDGNSIKGLDKQIEDLKLDSSVGALFKKETNNNYLMGVKPAESSDILSQKDINSMNYEELCAYMETNHNTQI